MVKFGIVYKSDSKNFYKIDGPYYSVSEARANFEEKKMLRFSDGTISGADVFEIDLLAGKFYPKSFIETIKKENLH